LAFKNFKACAELVSVLFQRLKVFEKREDRPAKGDILR